jgi:preprotein translocase subunit YajC
VSLTARDRKILMLLIPVAIVVAYWFLLLAPKRQEATKLQDQLTSVQAARDTAVQKVAGLGAAKQAYARDYATVIYLGKSVPASVDMPSLLVQLDRASRGTGIKFTSIKTGDRAAAGSSTAAPAQTGTKAQAQASTSAQPTTPAAAGGAQAGANSAFDSIPLDFQFDGSFFDLTDFFHRMKRFVRVANDKILVRGRLMTVNSFSFAPATDGFPHLTATIHATVYLAPKSEGVAAGGTPQGPAGAPAPAGQTASTSSTPPAATVISR